VIHHINIINIYNMIEFSLAARFFSIFLITSKDVTAGKFPTLVTHQETLESKVNETKAMVKFQLKKVLCMGVAVGNCSMEEKQLFQNVQMSVNFLVSLLKKNWQNVSFTYINYHLCIIFLLFSRN
jgi:large subunit ribosomal protein L10Ae